MAAVAHPARSQPRRFSPMSTTYNTHAFSTGGPTRTHVNISDSDSDDEPPPVMKLSKAAQALLGEDPLPSPLSGQEHPSAGSRYNLSTSVSKAALDTPSRISGVRIVRNTSAPTSAGGKSTTPPRVVQVGTRGSASGKRVISLNGTYPHRVQSKRDPTPEPSVKPELVTPAPRIVRTRIRAGSNASQDDAPLSSSRPGSRAGFRNIVNFNEHKSSDVESKSAGTSSNEQPTREPFGTNIRSQINSTETGLPTGSQRIKRAPAVTAGSLFKSKPVRRGFRRRESEENTSANDEAQSGSASTSVYTPQGQGSSAPRRRRSSVHSRGQSVEPISRHDFAREGPATNGSRPGSRQASARFQRAPPTSDSRPTSRQASHQRAPSRERSVERYQSSRQPEPVAADPLAASSIEARSRRPSIDHGQQRSTLEQMPALPKITSINRSQYRYAGPKIHTDAAEDQENMPPPTFRRNKDQDFKFLGKPSLTVMSDDAKPNKQALVDETPVPVPAQQVERKILGAMSGNTPHRPAPPPPPKMSVLQTATMTAGASSVSKSKKKRSHLVINGKIFTQMAKIGKGGSSDVYCVMAENWKTFAVKKVKLDDCDESALRGYKGEIDLLKKLEDVDRVVRLYDWELNEAKQELIVLMEKGDTDLNRLLSIRLSDSDSKFDATFARYHWKEMLECVQAVHEHDIVHSDLKPANFLIVSGRLKLIDFGIANAIDTDNTVNVHRDSHVGTPNYMSPESITDTNAPQPGQMSKDAAGRPLKKDMRIGKSSDVWSLGCMLYQMTYGRPPFAHISNQISRIMAITNPKHVIEFPERGIGNAYVPPSLRGTLRKCLNREPEQRPTIPQLLSDTDPFLNPDSEDAVLMSEQTLGMIIQRVVERCKDSRRGMPTPEEIGQYPRSFLAKIKERQAYT